MRDAHLSYASWLHSNGKMDFLFSSLSFSSFPYPKIFYSEERQKQIVDYELKENVGGLVTLYTLGGTAVGAIIGSTIQRKKSYYVHATKNEL